MDSKENIEPIIEMVDKTVCPHCGARMIIEVAMPDNLKVKLYVGAVNASPKPKEEDLPKTRKALDGVNTITTQPDGTEVSTLIHPVKPSPKPPTKESSDTAE